MKANEYGIKNLKWMMPKLAGWLNEKGENYENLDEVYNELIGQFSRYFGHVATYVGGIYTDYKTTEQAGEVYLWCLKPFRKKQWLSFRRTISKHLPGYSIRRSWIRCLLLPATALARMQDRWLGVLLNTGRMQRLISSANRDASAYRLEEFMEDLKKGIWSELATRKPIDNYPS